jgi:hypothetical protein
MMVGRAGMRIAPATPWYSIGKHCKGSLHECRHPECPGSSPRACYSAVLVPRQSALAGFGRRPDVLKVGAYDFASATTVQGSDAGMVPVVGLGHLLEAVEFSGAR